MEKQTLVLISIQSFYAVVLLPVIVVNVFCKMFYLENKLYVDIFNIRFCTNVAFTLNMASFTMNIAVSYDKLH